MEPRRVKCTAAPQITAKLTQFSQVKLLSNQMFLIFLTLVGPPNQTLAVIKINSKDSGAP